jgi:hypothetical protein
MKRTGWFLLAVTLTGPGCLSALPHHEESIAKPPPVQVVAPPPPPVVTPDEVTEANAYEKAKALRAEEDYAENERPAALQPAPVEKARTNP